MESTRPAHQDDRAACVALLTRALSDVDAMRGGATLRGDVSHDELLARWLDADDTDDAALYVGEFHHVVVGLAAAVTFTRHGSTVRSGRIECCFVEEGARGSRCRYRPDGVDGGVVRAKRLPDIDALALPGDRLSKQRLEASGFTARLLVLNRPLD